MKDKNFWKEYNQKNDRKEYMRNLMREKREKSKQVANRVANTFDLVANKNNLVANIQEVANIPAKENLLATNPEITMLATFKSEVVANRKVADSQLSEIERRFFTFLDGKKIARTKCGCNPVGGFYDWCKDDCSYFVSWREVNKNKL